VLTRALDTYGPILDRTFRRRGIPCFLDQRFPIRHHPLVELTRSAVRIAIAPNADEDWFAWLKCGLLDLPEWAAERMENALLAKRWKDHRWSAAHDEIEPHLREKVVGPIEQFRARFEGSVDAKQLCSALRSLWQHLGIERVLEEWDRSHPDMFSHRTVLRETEAWLDELLRGFGTVSQSLRAWMPIMESAWSAMSAGAIPPALDQVLVGTIDRSRNPDLRLVILPGWAEDVFPARPPTDGLLSRTEMERLEDVGLNLGTGILERVGHERFYAYIALTRTRENVVVTVPSRTTAGRTVMPSPFLRPLPAPSAWTSPACTAPSTPSGDSPTPCLDPNVALALLGNVLRTSASGLEQAALCPLQHGLSRMLSVRERIELEYDARREGTLQHQLLAEFHRSVRRTGRRWRDILPAEAFAILGSIAGELFVDASPSTNFERETTLRSVRRFLGAWLRYAPSWPLDPSHAELRFGRDGPLPALSLDTPRGSIHIEGSIDRIDLGSSDDEGGSPLCAVDYKLSGERFSEERLESGRQLQLPVYLLAAMSLPGGPHRGVGMVYASLSPDQPRLKRRDETGRLACDAMQYGHRGRIDAGWALESHGVDWSETPFRIRFRKDGAPDVRTDAIDSTGFGVLLEKASHTCARLGESALRGEWLANPMVENGVTACGQCAVRTACRHPGK
jgi:ATP-dependent helicase/nuclease subunit B